MTARTPLPDITLPSTYDPAEVEERRYAWWESSGFFTADAAAPGKPFAITMPPPNVTGDLHMGHALTTAIEDALIRRARMRGCNAVWLPGMDHAGIATQNAVEKQLAAQGTSRRDLGREVFVERIQAFTDAHGGTILRQLRRLGASADWDRQAYTLDEPRAKAVREVFVRLYDQGLISKGLRLINWDPVNATALSDIEVDHVDTDGELTHIRYPASDGGEGVVVATTRPETMLGDTAVAVHPDDARYTHLVGRTLRLPLMDRDIPVLADVHVDPEFGTGAVKVTPAHDPNDYEIGRRHDLEMIDVMTDTGAMSAAAGPYEGLDRFEARTQVAADLEALGLIVKVEPHRHAVGVSSRSGGVVEPRLSEQWFVRTRPLADAAAQAVRDGRTRFVPERATKGFLDWLDGLHDWCISRQLWWGHRVPVWYDRDGGMHALTEDPTSEEVAERGLTQDPDVLDTWFSSQLWPFTTLGWTGFDDGPNPDLERWYPNQVMETGYDINTFWVSRMLMIGLHVMGDVPFRVVFNHGMVRDGNGKKMSKSFGNVIDPLTHIDRYGADALRFALLRASSPGVDVPLAEEWVEGARRFANKLWNAARFTLMQLGDHTPKDPPARTYDGARGTSAQGLTGEAEPTLHDGARGTSAQGLTGEAEPTLQLEDRWILSRLEAARAAADDAYGSYDLARVARALYHFVWDEYCDWYLELAKLRDDDAARATLAHVLDTALRLLHPLMPFVTEEIWQALHRAASDQTIMRAQWPTAQEDWTDTEAEAELGALQEAVTALRRFRADHGLSPKTPIEVTAVADVDDPRRARVLAGGVDGITRLANVGGWTFADEGGNATRTADGEVSAVGKVAVSGAELRIPLEGLIDLDGERERLRKELVKAESERARAERKLGNEAFVSKAPEAVVRTERDKVSEWAAAITALRAQLADLG